MSEITLLDGSIGQELVKRSGEKPTPLWSTTVMLDDSKLLSEVHDEYFSMGATVATRFMHSGKPPLRMAIFAIISPIIIGTLGIIAAHSIGLSIGGSAVFGIMAASASYIAAPSAVRIALPNADSGLSLGLALGVTFPFNLTIGIPLAFMFSRSIG